MKRIIKSVIFNVVVLLLVYLGLYEDNEQCLNVVKFLIWFNFIGLIVLTLISSSFTEEDKEFKKLKEFKELGLVVTSNIYIVHSLFISCLLAANGLYLYTTLEIISTILIISFYKCYIYEETCDTMIEYLSQKNYSFHKIVYYGIKLVCGIQILNIVYDLYTIKTKDVKK